MTTTLRRCPVALNKDLRELPRYSIPDAAAYAQVKVPTLETWVRGRDDSPSVIIRPREDDPRLSYYNLIECYVLGVARRFVSMQRVRAGLEYMRQREGVERFLLHRSIRFRIGALLWEDQGQLRNTAGGQLEIREVVGQYLNRIEYRDDWPIGFFPVTRPKHPDGPQRVVIHAEVAFGRPVTRRNFIATAVIASRFGAGESVSDLADDYDLESADVEEAIREEKVRSERRAAA